jgi:parallel beta-helix repeat protein
MLRALGCVLLCILLVSPWASARIWYVKPDGTGQAINIQAGIDSSAAGDTVLVASGGYRGDGNRDIDFRGKPIVVLSEDRYDATVTDSVVLDCAGGPGNQHHGFYFHSGESNSSIAEGFVIINGYGNRPVAAPLSGGGIVCDSASSPTIRFNRIYHCAGGTGGGILVSGSSAPVISDNEIYLNESDEGGGICCISSSALIVDNYIHDNWAWIHDIHGGSGGGIVCSGCEAITIRHNKILRNSAVDGGGMFIGSSSAVIEGNDISGCHATAGAAIYAHRSMASIIKNDIRESAGCYGTLCIDSSVVAIDDNHVHENKIDGCPDRIPLIFIFDSEAEITNNRISSNRPGGIYYSGDSTGTIENNVIEDGYYGGGITCCSSISITGNIIRNNYRSDIVDWPPGGGGIGCLSSALVRDNQIIGNFTRGFGGGIYSAGPSPLIANNTIVGNSSREGGGIYIDADSHPTLSRNIVASNRQREDWQVYPWHGGGISSDSDSIQISCCDVFDNEGGNYVGLPDQTGLNGNISIDPVFCDIANGDYALHVSSPCLPGNHPDGMDCGLIGALGQGCAYIATLLREYHVEVGGSAVIVRWTLSEVGKHIAFFVLRAAMPATEYREISDATIARDGLSFTFTDVTCEHDATYGYRVDVSDEAGRRVLFETDPITMPAAKLVLFQNYPNPFNPSTSIRYELPRKTMVKVEIYSVSGARVVTLVDEEQERGPHSIQWDGTDELGNAVASGVYFCRLEAGKERISKKMILLR